MTKKKEFQLGFKTAVKALARAKRVLVVSHLNPDGDTLGCMLALGLALMQKGKKVTLLCQDGVPTRYQFLPGSELVQTESRERFDASVAVDCGGERQLGTARSAFFRARTTIQVDHHDFGDAFGKVQVLEPEASAVGEIVFHLIQGLRAEITPAIATCLLTSIVVDTGAFRFSNTRPKTFEICARLSKQGVDVQHLIEEAYWVRSRSMALLSSFAVLNAQFSKSGAVSWSVVSQSNIKRFGANLSDADSVADELRSIEGVKIAALFRETERGSYRVSLRSRKGIHVAAVAARFGGGGHHNSAGCSIKRTAGERKKFLKALEELVA
jgi:bifunctional oligoribonuclease and PAP phosphatase NrnA